MDDQKATLFDDNVEPDNPGLLLVPLCSLFLLVAFLGLFHQTAWRMVETWIRSETYAHGMVIVPMVAWLIWRRRSFWMHFCPETFYPALFPLTIAGFVWLLGNLVDVLVVQQLALVAMIVSAFVLVMGATISRTLMFPLSFLFLAVPMGEELVPSLMEYTASVTTLLVKLTGIPVYRDGMFISLPSGNWSVVEACSGIRYLIASLTLGCLFAYINYTNNWKRLAFILVSAIVPIIANGLRAYMIVMIGHFSDMKLAVGVDHLIYGWVFFGLIMFLLFLIGSRWRDPDEVPDEHIVVAQSPAGRVNRNAAKLISSLILALVVGVLWPAWGYGINHAYQAGSFGELASPDSLEHWQLTGNRGWDWYPSSHGADGHINQFYTYEDDGKRKPQVSLSVAHYHEQKQGAEVVNARNRLFNSDVRYWRVASKEQATGLQDNALPTDVTQAVLKGPGQALLVWQWYRVGSYYTDNKYMAKIWEVMSLLLDGRRDAAIITVSAPIPSGDAQLGKHAAALVLDDFVTNMLPQLESLLDEGLVEARSR